jgi:hypothetical protein
MWKNDPPAFVALPRTDSGMSGTKARQFVTTKNIESFRKAVMFGDMTISDADALYEDVKKGLIAAVAPKPRGGKTRRRKRRRYHLKTIRH